MDGGSGGGTGAEKGGSGNRKQSRGRRPTGPMAVVGEGAYKQGSDDAEDIHAVLFHSLGAIRSPERVCCASENVQVPRSQQSSAGGADRDRKRHDEGSKPAEEQAAQLLGS